MRSVEGIIESLLSFESISNGDIAALLLSEGKDTGLLFESARLTCERVYGREVFIRGLIEISSYCKNDCYYCGIRRSNRCAERYRLTDEEIFSCAAHGHGLGFRTFVLQGGEDAYFTDERLCGIIKRLKSEFPDSAVTLSLGERSDESYKTLRDAGADRYLLRHESATRAHYGKLHPPELSFENRIHCLHELKALGYQTGCGFMVGSPHQTLENIVADIRFIEKLRPEMVGIGPYITHKDTPFKSMPSGSVELTLKCLAIVRLICPTVLLPATTALGTAEKGGRERGILAGANVIMPNLSPEEARTKYLLYDNKLSTGAESAEGLEALKRELLKIGYKISKGRGDHIKE